MLFGLGFLLRPDIVQLGTTFRFDQSPSGGSEELF